MRTQVGIIGGGPAGVLLARLLHLEGISSIVVERRSRAHVEGRIRAGVLEQGTVELLDHARVSDRLHREGLRHDGINISIGGSLRRIDFRSLTRKGVTIYGQTEVQKDLDAAHLEAGGEVVYGAAGVRLEDIDGRRPRLSFRAKTGRQEVKCDFVAGCDGFHGVSRRAIPRKAVKTFERRYPFAWLGILTETPPVSEELIYARHEHGFALFSMRSSHTSRLYLQCRPEEDLNEWPDERVWEELRTRLGGDAAKRLQSGPSIERIVAPMRSFVAEPMQYGRLFLAGDAAHIVPPTGAKGLNLAAADVRALSLAFAEFYRSGSRASLERYSEACLKRVWRAQRFSWWMTSLLHRFPDDEYANRIGLAELDYVTSSPAASAALAENYVGLPFE